MVGMDLEKFFDTVNHSRLIEVLSRTIKDGRVISLIHKYPNAGVLQNGFFEKTEEGVHNPIHRREIISESKPSQDNSNPCEQDKISGIHILPEQREMQIPGTP